MYATSMMVNLAEAGAAGRAMLGGKAATLAELSAAGFAVPPGIVVTASALDEPDLDDWLEEAAARLGGDRFAVRSSGAAEDLPDASYAGLYET
jgi:rifampicin phosphotransferase